MFPLNALHQDEEKNDVGHHVASQMSIMTLNAALMTSCRSMVISIGEGGGLGDWEMELFSFPQIGAARECGSASIFHYFLCLFPEMEAYLLEHKWRSL